MAKEKTKKKDISNNREVIELKEFLLLKAKDQEKKIKETLDKMYEETQEVEKKHIEKVLNIAFDTKDNETYLPDNLRVQKDGNKLIFTFKKKKMAGLILLFALAFLFIGGFATYTGVQYLSRSQLNIDLDDDGVPDLNIDRDNDGICDINCDTTKDSKPDYNIDFHANRRAIFNVIQRNGQIFNPTNQDTNGDGVCDINCDTNDDGWPDVNIDYDGNGTIDFDRDIDGDGIKDLDLDFNGDGVCDLNCDYNKDDICDSKCTNMKFADNGNGTSSSRGNGSIDASTADLVVIFDSVDTINAELIYPDDQVGEDVNTKIPDLTFSIRNTTEKTLYYNIDWSDIYNDFETNNFWVKVTSTNNGYNRDWRTAPFTSGRMVSNVAIAPRTTQEYTMSFTLHGTGEEQNEDQGRTFRGRVIVDIVERY